MYLQAIPYNDIFWQTKSHLFGINYRNLWNNSDALDFMQLLFLNNERLLWSLVYKEFHHFLLKSKANSNGNM